MDLTTGRCEASSLAETKEMRAHDALYMDVAAYFRQACSLDRNDKIVVSELAPIYFQHQGTALFLFFRSGTENFNGERRDLILG